MTSYGDEARRIIDNAHYEAIKILVWGPGNPGQKASATKRRAYEKRLEIRKVLKEQFPRADVQFSEDPEMIRIARGVRGQLRKEAL